MPRCDASFLSSGDTGIFSIYILAPTLLSLQSCVKSIRRPSLTSIIDVASLTNFFESLASGIRCLLSNGSTTFQDSPFKSSEHRVRSLNSPPHPFSPPRGGRVREGVFCFFCPLFSRGTGLFIFFSNSRPQAELPR